MNLSATSILLILILLDYLTGVLVAILERKNNSTIGRKGIINKIGIIMCILLCRLIDLSGIIGSEHILPIVSFFFIMNESFSIMENLKQLNVPIPDFLATKLDNLKNMGKKNKNSVDKVISLCYT